MKLFSKKVKGFHSLIIVVNSSILHISYASSCLRNTKTSYLNLHYSNHKQSPRGALQKTCSEKFCPQPATFLKKRLRQRCFPLRFANFSEQLFHETVMNDGFCQRYLLTECLLIMQKLTHCIRKFQSCSKAIEEGLNTRLKIGQI